MLSSVCKVNIFQPNENNKQLPKGIKWKQNTFFLGPGFMATRYLPPRQTGGGSTRIVPLQLVYSKNLLWELQVMEQFQKPP